MGLLQYIVLLLYKEAQFHKPHHMLDAMTHLRVFSKPCKTLGSCYLILFDLVESLVWVRELGSTLKACGYFHTHNCPLCIWWPYGWKRVIIEWYLTTCTNKALSNISITAVWKSYLEFHLGAISYLLCLPILAGNSQQIDGCFITADCTGQPLVDGPTDAESCCLADAPLAYTSGGTCMPCNGKRECTMILYIQ